MPPKLYIELGRTGDIVNILPLMLREHSHDNIFRLMVAKEYWPLLQGCSYVKPVIYHGEHNQPGLAEAWAKIHKPGEDPVVCQVENNPHDTRRVTDSYQKESWRLAGALEEFGRWPLVFDQRKAARESELVGRYRREKPLILFGGESLSSPFGDRDRLLATLRSEFMDYDVIDLATIKLPHIFDLLGLYDAAALLVSVDTVHLHLCRASHIPVIALTNEGWLGSVPPPCTLTAFRYSEVLGHPLKVVAAARAALSCPPRQVFHCVDLFGATERHARARRVWQEGYQAGIIPVHVSRYQRNARQIGCDRPLPFLKDVLMTAMIPSRLDDVVLFGPDDVAFKPAIGAWATQHVGRFGAASMRRTDGHCGRDLFGFTKRWLDEHWDEIPDFILGVDSWDTALAVIIRHQCGIASTLDNLTKDFFPCETDDRLVLHEDHPSSWYVPGYEKEPAAAHNRRLFRQWAQKHQPRIPFNDDNVIQ